MCFADPSMGNSADANQVSLDVSSLLNEVYLYPKLIHCLYRAPDRPFLEVERTTQDGGPFNTGKVGVSLYPI